MKTCHLRAAFFSLLLAVYTTAYSQIPEKPYNIQSPNVSAMMLYGEIPVSHYTGTPNISIPLYTIQHKQVSESISLSYHASGVRPDQHPGWTGMGWSLNAGGVISRVVRDLHDDDAVLVDGVRSGFLWSRFDINNTAWNQTSFIKSLAQSEEHAARDTEPDEFSFSFNGYSGKFYLDATHPSEAVWKVKCDKPIKVRLLTTELRQVSMPLVVYDIDVSRKTINGFEITTEDGTIYEFGNSDTSIEYEVSIFRQITFGWSANSWFLTKVKPLNGEEINYSYVRGDYISQMYISDYTKNFSVVDHPYPCNDNTSIPSPANLSYEGSLVAPVYLSEINTINSKIKFTISTTNELRYRESVNSVYSSKSGTGSWIRLEEFGSVVYPDPAIFSKLKWKQLDKIEIFQNSNLLKSFEFKYTNSNTKRLTLLELKEKGSNGASNNPYQFKYDESKPLPDYLEFTTDHWGFYNNKHSDNVTNLVNYYGLREPDPDYLRAGSLTGIIYPTGGVTSFEYEPHTYSQQLKENRTSGLETIIGGQAIAGGLRIKKISSFDLSQSIPSQIKEYIYDKSGVSTGVLGGKSKYYFPGYRLYNNASLTLVQDIFSRQSILPASTNTAGNHIGYSEVKEILGDGSFNIYTFSNFGTTIGNSLDEASVTLNPDLTSYQPISSLELQRGKLRSETSYNNSGVQQKSKTYIYEAINKDAEFVRAIKARWWQPCIWIAEYFLEGAAYKNYTFSYLPTTETITEAGHTITKTYSYDLDKRLLASETLINSDGNTYSTTYKRSYNLISNPVYANMTAANILSPIIEEKRSLGSNQISKIENIYSETSGKFYHDLTRTQTHSLSPWITRNVFTYDDKMNIKTSAVNTSGPITSYLLSYSGQYPIARIENAPYSTVLTALGGQTAVDNMRDEPNPSNSTLNSFLANLRTSSSLKDAFVTTYTHLPLIGVSSTTDAKGMTTSFEYDSFQRLQNVKNLNGEIVKNYKYNIRPAGFYNEEQSDYFTKSNCVSGLDGGDVFFKVPAFKYYSTVGQAAANNLAITDLYANGQAFADSQKACLMYARYEVDNIGYDGYPDGSGGYYSEENGDVYIKFYVDMACTIPLALPYDVVVKARETYNQNTNFGSSTFSNDYDYTGYQGTNNIYMGNYVLNSSYTYTGGWESTNWVIDVISDQRLPYIVPQLTQYNY